MSRDWDNLVLLDACRYDYFVEENWLSGRLQSVVSRGSHSGEFIEKNFTGRDLSDTVYVTANPNISRIGQDTFYTVENCLKHWDEDLGTVHPEDVVDMALKAHGEYPNKRLIIHFMQPHQPYIGPTAEKISDKLQSSGYTRPNDGEVARLDNRGVRDQWAQDQTWTALQDGVLSNEEVRKAYRESLNLVLTHVETLLERIGGKSVISADHGEYLGERRFPYFNKKVGHPWEYTTELRIVPWLEVDADSRREIIGQPPIGFERLDEEVVRERLRDFGYLSE